MKAVDFDNRGTDDYPFGFVYFDDGKRIVYSKQTGVTDGTGGWAPITKRHLKTAAEFLKEKGILG